MVKKFAREVINAEPKSVHLSEQINILRHSIVEGVDPSVDVHVCGETSWIE